MAKPFRRLVEDLPAERPERIEAHTQVLIQEYELLNIALLVDVRVEITAERVLLQHITVDPDISLKD